MLAFLQSLIDDFSSVKYIGAIVFLLTLMVTLMVTLVTRGITTFDKQTQKLTKHFDNPENINYYVKEIKKDLSLNKLSIYKETLKNQLEFVSSYLGELKIFSLKTFAKHLSFSIIYSFLFFYISWMMGGASELGNNVKVFTNENKLIVTTTIIFEILVFYFIFKKLDYIDSSKKAIVGIVVRLAIAIIIGVAVMVGVGVGVAKGSNVLLLFFLLLPVINAVFDYISTYFSRLFALKIYHTSSNFKIFGEFILDVLIACILFVGLAFALYYTVDLTNHYLMRNPNSFIPIESYTAQLRTNPFHPDVLWITMMFFSTLVPTILHLLLVFSAFLSYLVTKPYMHTLLVRLESFPSEKRNDIKDEQTAMALARYTLSTKIKFYVMGFFMLLVFIAIVSTMFYTKKEHDTLNLIQKHPTSQH